MKELMEYNKKILGDVGTSNILDKEDINSLSKCMTHIERAMSTSQIFRTDTEMRISVLNDIKFPTVDSKYWQAIREMDVMSEQLFLLNYRYREELLNIKEYEEKLLTEENEIEKERLNIKIERSKFSLFRMRREAKDRIRELGSWATIIVELEPNMVSGIDNANSHQLMSYGKRFLRETVVKINSQMSAGERENMAGHLMTTRGRINSEGLMDKFVNDLDAREKEYLMSMGIVKLNSSEQKQETNTPTSRKHLG